MKIIFTEEGGKIYVDDTDYNYLNNLYRWKISKDGYAISNARYKKMGLFSGMTIHKIIKHPTKSGRYINVDHIDGNKLNNTRGNLRVCTHEENMRNRKVQEMYAKKKKVSKYKGVTWNKGKKVWEARISIEKKYLYLGSFSNELAAANCYNYWSDYYYKDFSRPNECAYMKKEDWESCRVAKDKTSKYKGVSNVKEKWIAQIWDGKRNIKIGNFDNEDDAAMAYNEKAKELKGDRARVNTIVHNVN